MSAPERGPARTVALVGAGGGCGTSVLAGALAMAWRRRGAPTWLVELDPGRGDLAASWDLPGDRTLDDLAPVAGEIAPAHLAAAAQRHASGVEVIVAPDDPCGAAWASDDARRLVTAARSAAGPGGRCVVDLGGGARCGSMGALTAADAALVVCPPLLSAARRARALRAAVGPRCVLVLVRGPHRGEVGARVLARAAAAPVLGELPWSVAEAAELGAGRWPRRRRRGLVAAVEELSEALA